MEDCGKKRISSHELFPAIENILAEHRQVLITITGMSMWPFLCHNRDQVVLSLPDKKRLKKGDIVLFKTVTGKYLLHRIMKITDKEIVTAGDGNLFLDGEFSLNCVKAVVVKMVRKGKMIDCKAFRWRCIADIWMFFFFMRKYLLKLLRWIAVVKKEF